MLPECSHSVSCSVYSIDFVLSTIDLSLACYFALYFLLRLWLAESRVRFLLSWSTLVDVITIVPVFVAYHSSSLVALSFLRILRVLRVLRLFNMTKASRGLGTRDALRMAPGGQRGWGWRVLLPSLTCDLACWSACLGTRAQVLVSVHVGCSTDWC
jgi:hypothetical protein